MEKKYGLTVIGAGPGGYEAALEAAKLGFCTALIEKGEVGGTCLNRGCIPTKALLHSASLLEKMKKAEEFGVRAEKIQADMDAVQDKKEQTIETLRGGIRTLLKNAGVTVYEGWGKILSPQLVEVAQENRETVSIPTERILIATGSAPAAPPIPGIDLPGVTASDGLLDGRDPAPDSLLIIGGGVIGVEFAGIYQAFGTKVTIVEALPSLLANMDRELGQSVKLSLKKKGVDIFTGAKVEKLEECPKGIRCIFTEKGEMKTCEAAKALVAAGRRPFTEGLFAPECTPRMERGRILVNEEYETSIPGIYAVGDVNGQIQLAHAATAQGIRAVRAMKGRPETGPMVIPSCVYTEPEIASVGLTAAKAKEQGIPAKSRKILSSANGKSVLSGQERGFIKVIYREEDHAILGAQLYCARATDMVGEFAVAIRQGMTMEEMASVIRPHPSFGEMISDAVTL